MKKQPHCKALKRGFSLVELSIALVIIGLLIGGIMSLSSYVANAKLNTMMNESKYYTSAFNQFQTRYNAPPGDYASASLAWTGAGNGDGNGLIRANGVAGGNTVEYYYAFQHLAMAGFIQGNYTGVANSSGGATANGGGATTGNNVAAVSAMDHVAYLFDHPDQTDGFVSGDTFYPNGVYGNILRVAGLFANSATIPKQPFLSTKEAQKIDDKYDDGMPYTGNVLVPLTTTLASCTVAATSSYNTAVNGKNCYLLLKMQ